MTYNEIASGGIVCGGLVDITYIPLVGGVEIGGCSIISTSHRHVTSYGVGDILYDIAKARRGVLEKIVIKQILVCKTKFTGGAIVVLYKDTFNALWNEYDLVDFDDAKEIAENYYLDLIADLEKIGQC